MELTLSNGPFLILSDLHIGHQATLIEKVEQLGPLFTPGVTVIFNGDTFEMRRKADREMAAVNRAKLEALLVECQARAVFINGNHDPLASEINHVEFAAEEILITHGDILFSSVAPWSRNARLYERAHLSELKRLPPEKMADLESRLGAVRRATLAYDIRHPRAPQGVLGSLMHLADTVWPPWRPLTILQSWAQVPDRAKQFASQYRPATRWLIIGHSHLAGSWMRDGLRILNTGTMMRGFPRSALWLENQQLAVHEIGRPGRDFVLGKKTASFAL